MSQSTPPQPPQSPQPQAPGAYPPGPTYPPFGQYGYYGSYPWYFPPPPQPPTPAERPSQPGRARLVNLVIAVVAAVSTVVALALAAVAPAVATRAPDPTSLGFHQVYDSQLAEDTANWDVGQGCVFELGGLHAPVNSTDSTGTICPFIPSTKGDLTSRGFLLTAEIRGAAAVNAQQQPCIAFEGQDTFELTFDQSGNYLFESSPARPCGDNPSAATGMLLDGGTPLSGTIAWHTDGYTHNRISVSYSGSDQVMTVYVNDQHLFQQSIALSGQYKIDLGASGDGEAVFSRFTLFSGTSA
jgi:hypothetical protein